ncbi:hypothetical protein [Candidatus Symbiopectobacterium sp.]|uniref:hypothetical protein n=1 Tax=Candidatus Symbiopectobacterium sp. TaxID=2816440 RepID=UPI0025C654F1|nr:hypothetical protein [Candidatus Symbiopectobacterium sp.]
MRGSVVSLGCQHKIYLFNKAPKQACHNSIIPYYSTKPKAAGPSCRLTLIYSTKPKTL